MLLVGKFNSHCSFAENPILPTPINVNGRRLKFRHRDNRAGQGIQHRSPQYDYEMLCADIAQKQFTPLLTRLRAHDVTEFPVLLLHQGEESLPARTKMVTTLIAQMSDLLASVSKSTTRT